MRSAPIADLVFRLGLIWLIMIIGFGTSNLTKSATATTLDRQSPYLIALPDISVDINNKRLPVANEVAVWQPWEQRLTASSVNADPYRARDLRVTFRGPDGTIITADGFWDGDQTYAIRSMFPTPGQWSWSSSSTPADPGLTQSGTVQVGAATDSTVLTTHGRLEVAATGRSLQHHDGTPFFWLGDTAWAAPLQATPDEWARYLATRADQGFSVVQIALAPQWSGTTDRQGRVPFLDDAQTLPNPAFWEGLTTLVAMANQRGLVVLLVGLGDPLADLATPALDAPRFARQLAARLAGQHVILAPSFDHIYLPQLDAVAVAIRAAVPQALIIQHPGTSTGAPTNLWAQQYAAEGALSLYGNQSGHNGGDRALVYRQAARWTLALWATRPSRPVINLEAFYDANGTADGLETLYQGTALDARAAGYLSLLSGASGYSYGAYGVWGWERDPAAANRWEQAIQYPSARQMGVLRTIFSSVAWWQLTPAPERIGNPGDGTQTMALATSTDERLLIAYLPENDTITINLAGLAGLAGNAQVTWVNPSTGERSSGGSVTGGGSVTLVRPGAGDWIVLLQAL